MSLRPFQYRWLVPIVLAGLSLSAGFCRGQQATANLREADADFRAGVAAFSRNDLEAARHDFEEVVHLAPSVEQGHSALGAVLVRLGDNGGGIRELEKALSLRGNDLSAQQNLALALEQSGQPARALPWFAKLDAASRAHGHALPPAVLAAWARAFAGSGQFAPAVSKLKSALAGSPRNAELWDELGSVYARQQDWADAQQAFGTAIQINPALASAHFHLGMAMSAAQVPGALEELRKAEGLAPRDPMVALKLGESLAAAGNDGNAIPVLQRALELEPRSTEATYQLGLALQRADQVNESIMLLRRAAAADSGNPDILANLGMALCQAERAKEAVPILQRAVSLAPANPTTHENLAAAFIQLSQFTDAVSQLRAALKDAPDVPQLHYNLGLALKMEDDEADAIPEFEVAEKLNPSAAEPPYALGLLYLQAGRYADAERELSVSLRLQPQNGDGWATLGSVESHLNRLPQAVSALREAIRQRPGQPDPHLTLAAVLVRQNEPALAAAERKQAADLMRANMNRQRAEVATNSANDLLRQGKVADAIAEFRDALSFDPNDSEAHIGLANALQRNGNVAEAAQERQKAEALQKVSTQQDHRQQ